MSDNVSLLDSLAMPECWESFYEYKAEHGHPASLLAELRRFIDERAYIPVCDGIAGSRPFPLPVRSVISKLDTSKKRVVYTYPYAENTVLKLLTYLLLRKYDGLFCDSLYSFRPGRGAKDAVRRLTRAGGVKNCFVYKTDISDYFNSIPVDRLLPLLRDAVGEDGRLYSFLSSLLTEKRAVFCGEETEEQKGIMAGTPLSAFYANLYLSSLDSHFEGENVLYARYSDDIIIFAPTEEELTGHVAFLRSCLELNGLKVNPSKEEFIRPGEPWTFLGFIFRDGKTDVAPASVKKLKQKMRRKARALQRWQKRSGADGEKAAKAFIRVFNRKLFENPSDHELTWANWFFPVITTDESLREIDRYLQDCVRRLCSGTNTKARFDLRYEKIRAMGCRSLVHEYYKAKGGG